ncbi:MAG: extracellular solute-binding protein [Planctomycetota bacterium]
MAVRPGDVETGISFFQKFGLGLVGIFYVASVVHVYFLGPGKVTFNPDVKVLHLAHSQMQEGYREGFEEMIRRFETLQAGKGVRVKVIQTVIPSRGYEQWMITQLVSGEPADVLANPDEGEVRFNYFHPLSPYVGKPNPFNQGTPLDGIPWRDTFIDNMEGAFDRWYADYFGVGTSFSVYRVHANADLVEKATGSRRMPETFSEWMAICQKLKDYGHRIGEPIIPIGVDGMTRATLNYLWEHYYCQTNGNILDDYSRFCDGLARHVDIQQGLDNGSIDPDRYAAAADILREMGQYFMDGFTSVDSTQIMYLFSSGKVGFLPGHSAISYSIQRNSDFEVAIFPMPPIRGHPRYGKYFTGPRSEAGMRVDGPFGIPLDCKNFDLALELLQFMTSYEMNQLTMDACNWPPAVKFAQFKGFVKAFEPETGGNIAVWAPTFIDWAWTSHRKRNEVLEDIIQNNRRNAQEFFVRGVHAYAHVMINELKERLIANLRGYVMREGLRSQLLVGQWQTNLTAPERERLVYRSRLAYEDFTERVMWNFVDEAFLEELDRMQR